MKIKPLYIVCIEDHCEKVWRPDHDDLQKREINRLKEFPSVLGYHI